MKRVLKYILLIAIIIFGYKAGDKILDKIYLSKFHIVEYSGQTRYSTVNSVIDKKYKKADTVILVNTNYLEQAMAIAPYAYSKDIPVMYTEKNEISKETYKEIEKLGVKKVILVGGVNYISDSVRRSLVRNDYKVERIVDKKGIEFSLRMAEMMNKEKKVDAIAVVTDDELDLPNGISFVPYADRNNIPIFAVTNSDEDLLKIENFVKKNNIKKTYLIGITDYYNDNFEKVLPGVERIEGKDRFEVNKNMMRKLYNNKDNKKIYISKGGEVVHKRRLAPGQLINAMAITTLAADNNAPVMYIEESYFNSEEGKLIKEKGYNETNVVGFKLERRNFFNVERFKNFTTVVMMLIVLIMSVRILKYRAE